MVTTAERDGLTITLTNGDNAPITVTDEQFRRGIRAIKDTTPALIPVDRLFEDNGVDFLSAPEIEEVATHLIDRYDEFEHLLNTPIAYVWKRKGGESGGKTVFGKCVKASGLVKFFGEHVFVIWIAADNCREYGFSVGKLEALVYHELCHAGQEEKDGEIKAVLIPHDVEAFGSEIERYGLWTDDLVRIKPAFDSVQSTLPGFGE